MGKIKARDIIAGWPWPRSVTHPRINITGYGPLPAFIGTAQDGCDSDHHVWMKNSLYHARQSAETDSVTANPFFFRPILLSVMRITGRAPWAIDGWFRVIQVGYPAGWDVINNGLCGVEAQSPMSCTFCPYGHMMECHFPRTCDQTLLPGNPHCAHAQRDMMNEIGGSVQ